MGLTLSEVSKKSGVCLSYLVRIEQGQRFPSAGILRKIANPLGFGERELLSAAGYLSPNRSVGRVEVDPYVAMILGREPVEMQRKVIAILIVLKSVA